MNTVFIKSLLAIVLMWVALPMMAQDCMEVHFKNGTERRFYLDGVVEVSASRYDANGIMQAVDEEQLLSYADATPQIKFTVVGSGSELIQSEQTQYKDLSATAQDIATIAREAAQRKAWVSAELALPVYLRDNAWKKISEQGKP